MTSRAWFVPLVALAACAPTHSLHEVRGTDGRVRWDYEMVNGIPNGTGRVFHENGLVKSTGPYVNGVKQGTFVFYDYDGEFTHQIYYWQDVEVWRSLDRTATPPAELLAGLTKLERAAVAPVRDSGFSRDPVPLPLFTSLDRTTNVSRVGVQAGFGNTDELRFGTVKRLEAFANVRVIPSLSLYGQFSRTALDAMDGVSLTGRYTFDIGGAYQHRVKRVGDLAVRLGVLAPAGNDDIGSFVASTAAASQRPADAAAALPSASVVRTSASLTRAQRHLVFQADAGVDWVFGADDAAFDALLRGNLGAGIGTRLGMLSVELSNTVRASDPSKRVQAAGIGGTFWFQGVSLTALLSHSFDGDTAFTTGLGYDL